MAKRTVDDNDVLAMRLVITARPAEQLRAVLMASTPVGDIRIGGLAMDDHPLA